MQTAVITWQTIHKFDDLWWQHLCIRKRMFVDQMGWTIPHTKDAEWDQYDTAKTIYVITHSEGRCLAASRLNPCDSVTAYGSYMIRDAKEGRLAGIPCDLIESPPTDQTVWEATRFAADPELSPTEREWALAHNARSLSEVARKHGISELIALMPPAYMRWLRSNGLTATRGGPNIITGERRACVIRMNIAT